MRKFFTAIAVVLALSFVGNSAAHAATTGGSVTNYGDSNHANSGYMYYTMDTTPDQSSAFSYLYYAQFSPNNTQAFKLRSGCVGKSQYSGSAWPYSGTIVYKLSQNNLDLLITLKCS
jgi:hypothetical protein